MQAVHEIQYGQGLDCRVLVMGSCMGVIPLMALKAGATHVTVVDRCGGGMVGVVCWRAGGLL